ncbi:hypothetical protein [Photorhabdus heterorhabditis]|uniref:hypothetical protein n=1 Tax=Photorhabdus heterorhabditis TaxID=880156 RepID=UPI0021CFFA00|nr:hypothetical protein [Photorhabdus heterorhabditis]
MPEAARVGDTIGHSSAMAGLIAGTVIGSLISAAGGILSGALFVAGLAASCIGVGVLLIGASIAVGMAAGYLGDMARDACVSAGPPREVPAGKSRRVPPMFLSTTNPLL